MEVLLASVIMYRMHAKLNVSYTKQITSIHTCIYILSHHNVQYPQQIFTKINHTLIYSI